MAELNRRVEEADKEIEDTRASLTRYRAEYENLRSSLLTDRLTKNNEVAGLVEKQQRMRAEAADVEAIAERARKQAYNDEKRCAAPLLSRVPHSWDVQYGTFASLRRRRLGKP